MTTREAALVGLRDTLEHLTDVQQQLEWAGEAATTALLTEAMLRDLERCRRLVEALRRREPARATA